MSATTMPESAQTESVERMNFDNFVLKRWLQSVGPIRRCEVLKKLKTDLQNLGLSRRQVHRGLIQLVTKPRVILTRQPPYARYGLKNSVEEDEEGENKIVNCCTTNSSFLESHSRQKKENVQEPDTTERFIEGKSKHSERTDSVKVSEAVSINSNQGSVASSEGYKLEYTPAMLHSIDKALKQFDKLTSSKMNVHKKPSNKRCVIVSVDTVYKPQSNDVGLSKRFTSDENYLTDVEDKNTQVTEKISELVCDKVGRDIVPIFNGDNRNRIKLNLSSCYSKKANGYVKSEAYKKVDTDCMKSDIEKKLCSDRNVTDIKVDSVSNENRYSKDENNENVLVGTEARRMEENICEKKLHEPVTSDSARRKQICASVNECKKVARKRKKKLKNKFRIYFGNCVSVSEDEQEQDILRKRFEKRRKKGSVDSCDSGVCDGETNITTIDVEILKDIQKAIPDSTMYEKFDEDVFKTTAANNNTVNESVKVTINDNPKAIDRTKEITNLMEVECNKVQNGTDANNIRTEKEKIFQKKLINISERNTVIQSTYALAAAHASQITEQLKENVSIAETRIDSTTTSSNISEVCTPNNNIAIISEEEDPLKLQECNSDTKDLRELLHMSFTESCHITSSGNVLSIQETVEEEITECVTNKNVDENSNLKELSEIQVDCNQNVEEEVLPNYTEKNSSKDSNDIQLSFDKKKDVELIFPNNIHNVLNNENESAMQESELNDNSEKKNTRVNKVPQGRLRVLSSAELGSRWCPTPVNTISSLISQFSHTNTATMSEVPNYISSDATLVTHVPPVTMSTITPPACTTTVETTASENMKKSNLDPKFSESVYVTFVKIFNLIHSVRVSSITSLNYDKSLYIEFEKLRKILNTENYIELTEGVLCILNKELLVTPPLSLEELFRYTPIIKSLYIRTSLRLNIAVNKSNEYQTRIPIVALNQMTLNQNTYCNPQTSQNMCTTTSLQSRLQHLLCIPTKQSQASTNVKQPQQNCQETNIFQNNTPMNSVTTNNAGTQQCKSKMQTQRSSTQQKILPGYFVTPNPVTNMHATQGFSSQHSSFPSVGINHQGRRHISVPVTNAAFISQQYVPQNVFVPQVNTYYNVNVPTHPVQQNMNVTHVNVQNVAMPSVAQQYQNVIYRQPVYNISQGIQLQTTPQPAQSMFAMSFPFSLSKNTQQNEQKHQKAFPQVQMKIPQNRVPDQVLSSQHAQNTYPDKPKQPIPRAKKKKDSQISLESTTTMFYVLKCVSDIQKLILLQQMDFYFGCTTWLQQQFTSEQWRIIYLQRSRLLHFQTLLKHLVEKTMKDLLSNNSQANTFETNILTNVRIDIPKVVKIVVKENEGIHSQVEVPKADQEQCKTTNVNQDCTTHQKDLDVITIQNQFEKQNEATDNSESKELSNQEQELQIVDKKEVEKDKTVEKVVLLQINSPVKPSLETQTLETDVHQKDEAKEKSENSKDTYNIDTIEQSLKELENVDANVSEIIEDKASVISDIKIFNKDTLHQLNPHLVTVEISSNNDQITVIDTNAVDENKSVNEELKEHEKLCITDTLPSSENIGCEVLAVPSPGTPNNIECFDNVNANNSSAEEIIQSYIADVRSISVEAFEKMGEIHNVSTNIAEGNIEEEEIKVCLFCGKPSTVACSICLEAKYCSKVCSELHWEDHYKDCTPVERSVYL